MQIAFALVITLISACALNLGYLLEHSVASQLPPLSLRRPIASVKSLLGNPRWLLGFGIPCLWTNQFAVGFRDNLLAILPQAILVKQWRRFLAFDTGPLD